MRVRNGRWSLSRGSAVRHRPAAHLPSQASAWSPGSLSGLSDRRGRVQAQREQVNQVSPGAPAAMAPRSLRSRDPLRVSSAAAHAVMTRFL
jgi:hypothetical protein